MRNPNRTARIIEGRHVRDAGTRVTYTAEQSRRYNSQRLRLQRARSLRPARIEGAHPNPIHFYYQSPRSPSGFWRVTYTHPTDPGGGSGGGGSGSGVDTCWDPSVPVDGDTGLFYLERYSPWVAFPDDLGGGYWLNVDELSQPIFTLGSAPSGIDEFAGEDTFEAWLISMSYRLFEPYGSMGENLYYFVEYWSTTYVYPNFPPLPPPFASQPNPTLGIVGHTVGGNTYSSACPYPPGSTPPPPPPPPPPSDWRLRYRCTCPDYTRQERADLRQPYPSRQGDRNWRESKAGSPGVCKHIYATRIFRREDPTGALPPDVVTYNWPPEPARLDRPDWSEQQAREWAEQQRRRQRERNNISRQLSDQYYQNRRRLSQLTTQRIRAQQAVNELGEIPEDWRDHFGAQSMVDYLNNYSGHYGSNFGLDQRINELHSEAQQPLRDYLNTLDQLDAALNEQEAIKERINQELNARLSGGHITYAEYSALSQRYGVDA